MGKQIARDGFLIPVCLNGEGKNHKDIRKYIGKKSHLFEKNLCSWLTLILDRSQFSLIGNIY